jgi:hypothetical protein
MTQAEAELAAIQDGDGEMKPPQYVSDLIVIAGWANETQHVLETHFPSTSA